MDRRELRLGMACLVMVVSGVVYLRGANLSSFQLSVIFASLFTIMLYLIYEQKVEVNEKIIRRLKESFDTKVRYEKESDTFSYLFFDGDYSREAFLEIIKISCRISSRKAEWIVKHLENESQNEFKKR